MKQEVPQLFLTVQKWLIPKLSELACFVFRPQQHRQENAFTDE